uniref:FtsX-like permease family protein n=1 Tax=Roseivirga sp. TaxID=1964215 RepID=UPI00404880F0
MVTHFLKVALRSIRKRGLLSILNISGLSIDIASFLVISLYLFQETSYEKGFEDNDRIFRIEEHFLSMGRLAWSTSNLQYKLNEIPEIELYTRVDERSGAKILYSNNQFKVDRFLTVDSIFLKVFDFEMLQGSRITALNGPGDAIISEAFAIKVFGLQNAIGQSFQLVGGRDYVVRAVAQNPILRSHLDFDIAVYSESSTPYSDGSWFGIGGYTYVKAIREVEAEDLNDKLDALTKEHVFPVVYQNSADMAFEDWLEGENKIRFYAKPIVDIHLNSNLQFEIGPNGDRQVLITLAIISVFILVIAAINFMNLATARASQRTKEIGVRKVLGSRKSSLICQFLSESILTTLFAATIGAGISELVLSLTNNQFESEISLSLLNYPILLIFVFLGVILLGVLAGLYPAFYLSSVKMIPLLKGMQIARVLNMNFAKLMRNGLVVLQFTLSTTLIIAAIFIYGQLKHLREMDLGFAKDQVFVIQNASALKDNRKAFRNELLRLPMIQEAGYSFRLPADGSSNVTSTMLDKETSFSFEGFQIDENFQKVMGIELLEGKWFDTNSIYGDSLVVLNESAVKALGLKDPIGKSFDNYRVVIGVVKDFNYGNLRDEISPAMFWKSTEHQNKLAILVSPGNNPIQSITEVWSSFTNEKLEIYPLDQNFANQLNTEKQTADAVLIFTVLAIIISSLGLIGLAAFTADQRLQEFGIRKALGATVADIIKLFSFDFVKLIILAFIISIPIAIWGVNAWLQGFANRISLSAGAFVLAGILAIGIAIITILFQSIKTGRLNPVDTLRNE